jgi:hypothetical protein
MQAIKAVVENGNVVLTEPLAVEGRFEAIVIVLDPDPWDALIHDPRPRPELLKASREALEEYLQGETTPIDPVAMP